MSQPEASDSLVTELTNVRRRGLDSIDLDYGGKQRPVEAPTLERLARQYVGDQHSARIPLIRQLLDDALTAWGERGRHDEAAFVRRLFFAPDGGTPGRVPPGELLRAARIKTALSEDPFDERRRAIFRLFAQFLVKFPAENFRTKEGEPGQRRIYFLWLIANLAAAAAVTAVWLIMDPAGGEDGADRIPTTTTTPDDDNSTAGGTAVATFTFNSLDPDTQIVNVYPGVGDSAEDRTLNGTFRHGQTAPAVCKTTGRTVSSDPHVDQEDRSSDVWIQVIGQPDRTHYATVVYGDMPEDALASLPSCDE